MSCERILPLLPLLALDCADADEARSARAHVDKCERCAASLRELITTRAALASFTIADAAATDAAEIRATAAGAALHRESAARRLEPFRSSPRRLSPRIWKAAAALVVVGLTAGLAWTHGSVTLDRGTATLRIAWGARSSPSDSELRVPDDALEPVAVATALSELERRVERLEFRHEQDLLLLAKSVDRQQASRDRGVAERLRSLEESTHDGFVFTNSVLDGVATRLAKSVDTKSPADPAHD